MQVIFLGQLSMAMQYAKKNFFNDQLSLIRDQCCFFCFERFVVVANT